MNEKYSIGNWILLGYYLEPHVWIGNQQINNCDIAAILENKIDGIDLLFQKQGMVIGAFNTKHIPNFYDTKIWGFRFLCG